MNSEPSVLSLAGAAPTPSAAPILPFPSQLLSLALASHEPMPLKRKGKRLSLDHRFQVTNLLLVKDMKAWLVRPRIQGRKSPGDPN